MSGRSGLRKLATEVERSGRDEQRDNRPATSESEVGPQRRGHDDDRHTRPHAVVQRGARVRLLPPRTPYVQQVAGQDALLALWPPLYLPPFVRQAWARRHPQLARARARPHVPPVQ